MIVTESLASLEAALAGRLAFLNTGTGVAALRFYGGTKPASAADAPSTPMLVAVELENPAGTVAAGVLTLAPGDPGLILQSGAPTWCRAVNRAGATAFDMDVGLEGSGAACEVSTLDLRAGGLLSVLSAVLG